MHANLWFRRYWLVNDLLSQQDLCALLVNNHILLCLPCQDLVFGCMLLLAMLGCMVQGFMRKCFQTWLAYLLLRWKLSAKKASQWMQAYDVTLGLGSSGVLYFCIVGFTVGSESAIQTASQYLLVPFALAFFLRDG